MNKCRCLVLIFLLLFQLRSLAQSTENKSWFVLSHSQNIYKKWDGLVDVQVRSADKLLRVQTLLLRGALSYNINDEHGVALGYANQSDWNEAPNKLSYQLEHRIYQQYSYNGAIKLVEFTGRLRLEQRFVKETGPFEFSQRLRGLVGVQVPLIANKDFSKGLYAGVQNELHLNVHHKENANNSTFNQNRAYIFLGYRWSKSLETEFSYMNWQQKEKQGTSGSNVYQLMINTDF